MVYPNRMLGQQLLDAGIVQFAPGSQLDIQKSMGPSGCGKQPESAGVGVGRVVFRGRIRRKKTWESLKGHHKMHGLVCFWGESTNEPGIPPKLGSNHH